MRRPLIWASLAAAMTSALAAAGDPLTIIYVDDDAPEGGDGSTWFTAYRDLQDALDAARCLDPVEIRVADGTYIPSGADGTPRDRFLVDALRGGCGLLLDPASQPRFMESPMPEWRDEGTMRSHPNLSSIVFSIRGAFAGLLSPDNPNLQDPQLFTSVLSGDRDQDDEPNFRNRGDNCPRVLEVHSRLGRDTLLIEHFTIQGGCSDGSAAGVFLSPTTGAISLNHCVIEENDANEWGAGATVAGDSIAQLYKCNIRNNRSAFGGGLGVLSFARVNGCVFRYNQGGNGGAVASVGTLICSSSAFADNQSVKGGAIYSQLGFSRIFGSFFQQNHSIEGDAVWSATWTQMINCTMIQNPNPAADVWLENSPASLLNCIVFRMEHSPMVQMMGEVHNGLTFESSLINDDTGAFVLNDNPLRWIASTIAPPRFLDPVGADGDHATWADNDYRPGPGSDAIDAAQSTRSGNCDLDAIDVYGAVRAIDAFNYIDVGDPCRRPAAVMDIGAFEAPADTPRLCAADWNADEIVDVSDTIAFLSELASETLGADLNRDDKWDFFDVQLFLRDFAVGCP